MAEERLIDDDKDRKFKVVINDDGEEEIVFNPDAAVEDEGEATPADYFTAPETERAKAEDDKGLTPEQLAAKREQEEKDRKKRLEEAGLLCDKAKRDIKEKRYSTALEYLERAENIEDSEGEIYALRLTAYTKDFSDYSQIIKAAEDAEDIALKVSDERKKELYKKCGAKLEDNIASLRNTVIALDKQNEEGKAERAAQFKKDITTCSGIGGAIGVLFIAFFATCIYYALSITAGCPTSYIVYTAVFGTLAFISFATATLLFRRLLTAVRRLKMNKRNTSTQLGRDLLANQATLKAYIDLNNALKTK